VFERGGFDVMLGNPPWDVSQFSEVEYFDALVPEIATLTGEARKKAITILEVTRPAIWIRYIADKRIIDAINEFYRDSERFSLTATGKINTYAVFAETFSQMICESGRAGVILPSGIATDNSTSGFFKSLISKRRLVSLTDIENRDRIFASIYYRLRFCLMTLGHQPNEFQFACFLTKTEQLSDMRRQFSLTPEDIALINPNTHTCPIFRSRADAALAKKIYRSVPVLINESKGQQGDPWNLTFRQGLFNMTSDSSLFRSGPQIGLGGALHGDIRRNAADVQWLPLYEAKMIHQYDHRWATFSANANQFDNIPVDDKADHIVLAEPRYWVPGGKVRSQLSPIGWNRKWLMGWRDITFAVNERTMISTVIPLAGVGHNLGLYFVNHPPMLAAALLANFNSLVLDFCARQKIGGNHLTFFVVKQLPILPPSSYIERDLAFISQRVLQLTYTATDIESFAKDLGYHGPPFRWDPERNAVLRAELDAYFAYLYGLSRDELLYILDPKEVMGADYPSETFRVLKEREINDPNIGEYRTQQLVLEAWDRFAEDGTFDPARLQDPTHFDVVRRALVETRGQVGSLERERDELIELLKRSDATPLPTLFVEGVSDVTTLTAVWRAFHPGEPVPVTILAAGGTRQMGSLAGKGDALRQLLGDRLVFALADNDREGRDLVEDGRTRRGGAWRQQSNGIHWCLLAPTEEFVRTMKRFDIPESFWPFTIENAFPAALRRQAMAAGAYAVEEAGIQPAFLAEPGIAKKALAAAHQLDLAGDDAILYFHSPAHEKKLAFAEWVAASERRDRATFSAFEPVLEGLQAILDGHSESSRAGRTRLQQKA
jgi:hypothetical protein